MALPESCSGRHHDDGSVGTGQGLFDRTLGQPPDCRTAFLSAASDGDETIRRGVESLLAAHEAAGGFLETPVFRVAAETSSAMQPGDQVGRFEVIDLLGRGSMGEVSRTRRGLGRDVAIKVLPRILAEIPTDSPDSIGSPDTRIAQSSAHCRHPQRRASRRSAPPGDGARRRTDARRAPTGRATAPSRGAGDRAGLAGALEATHRARARSSRSKPANIKFTSSSGLKLLDFGLAKDVDANLARPGAPPCGATTAG